jgi:hypothetical protein
MKKSTFLHSAFLLCLLAPVACSAGSGGDGGGEDAVEETRTDEEVTPPFADGDWYRPGIETTWQWQLLGTVNTGYDVALYDIDLFDSPETLIAALQAEGIRVICYFSAGSSEDWRPDFHRFLDDEMGEPLDGWEGERWLDVRSDNVREIMADRLDLAVAKGCDGVEPDNVDGFTNDTGFDLAPEDQLAFNRWLADAAHERGLAIGLKNDGDQAAQLVDWFDFSLNEQCHEFDECEQLQPFLDAGKPVLNAEYAEDAEGAVEEAAEICPGALTAGIRTLVLPLDLDDSFRVSCDDLP